MNVGENVKKYMFFPGSKIMFYIHLWSIYRISLVIDWCYTALCMNLA
jgi:hypothetical protein